jgi:hypothetical protein
MQNHQDAIDRPTFSMNAGKHMADQDNNSDTGKKQGNENNDEARTSVEDDAEAPPSHITIVPFSTTQTGSFQ